MTAAADAERRIPLGGMSLPVHLTMTRTAVAFAAQTASLLSFSEDERRLLELAVEEAFANAVEHFSGPTEGESIDLECCVLSSDLIVSIRERGIPFDPRPGRRYSTEDMDSMDMPGLGTLLMQRAVDSVEFLNHGRSGKETRLVKRLGYGAVPEALAQERKRPRGRQRITVKELLARRATREELPEISRLAWRCYGYTQEAFLYDPEALAEAYDRGSYIPVVGTNPEDGAMFIHGGLKVHDPAVPVAELGLAFTDPGYRCPTGTRRMADAIRAIAREAGHRGTFDCSVTTHTHSQKAMQEYYGSSPCAVMLAIAAQGMHVKELATTTQPKGSVVNHYLPYDRSPDTVHLPRRHQAMAAEIYSWMEMPRTFAESLPRPGAGESDVQLIPLPDELNAAFIVVSSIGARTADEVAQALRQCRAQRLDAVYAFLPLADPGCPWLTEQCETLGLSFAGLMPHIHDGGDRLLMQRMDIDLDLDAIRLYGDRSRRLFAYVTEELARVSGR